MRRREGWGWGYSQRMAWTLIVTADIWAVINQPNVCVWGGEKVGGGVLIANGLMAWTLIATASIWAAINQPNVCVWGGEKVGGGGTYSKWPESWLWHLTFEQLLINNMCVFKVGRRLGVGVLTANGLMAWTLIVTSNIWAAINQPNVCVWGGEKVGGGVLTANGLNPDCDI